MGIKKNYWLFSGCVLFVVIVIAVMWHVVVGLYNPQTDSRAFVVSSTMLIPEIEVPLYVLSWLVGTTAVCGLYWWLSKFIRTRAKMHD
jgi:hypothetical protein